MRRNTGATTDRRTTTTETPRVTHPGQGPHRTTAGLVAATVVPALVVAAVVAPVATALVGTAVLAVMVALTVGRTRQQRRAAHDPGDDPARREGTPVD